MRGLESLQLTDKINNIGFCGVFQLLGNVMMVCDT